MQITVKSSIGFCEGLKEEAGRNQEIAEEQWVRMFTSTTWVLETGLALISSTHAQIFIKGLLYLTATTLGVEVTLVNKTRALALTELMF